jgi:hypothetical protein
VLVEGYEFHRPGFDRSFAPLSTYLNFDWDECTIALGAHIKQIRFIGIRMEWATGSAGKAQGAEIS